MSLKNVFDVRKVSLGVLIISILLVLSLSFIVWRTSSQLWWDEAIYVGMGKVLASGGVSGMWETFRPPVLPIVISAFEYVRVPVEVYRFLLSFFSSVLFLCSVFFLSRMVSRGSEGWSLLFSLSFVSILSLFPLLLTDILSTGLSVAALVLALRNRPFLAGLVAGVSVLTRFPQAVILPVLVIVLWYDVPFESWKRSEAVRSLKRTCWLALGSALLIVPYLVSQKVLFGGFFSFLRDGVIVYSTIGPIASLSWYVDILWSRAWWLVVAGLVGTVIVLASPRKEKRGFFVLLSALAMLSFLSIIPHKEERYVLMAVPFLAVLAGIACSTILEFLSGVWSRRVFSVVLGGFLVVVIVGGVGDVVGSQWPPSQVQKEFYSYGSNQSLEPFQVVLASDPLIMVYVDHPVKFFGGFEFARSELLRWRSRLAFASWNSCSYDCPLDSNNAQCVRDRSLFLEELHLLPKVWNATVNECTLEIYEGRMIKK